MKIRKRFQICFAILFAFLFFPAKDIFALSSDAEVSLTVSQDFEVGKDDKGGNYTGNYEFRALDKNIPMPEQEDEEVYSFSLEGRQAEQVLHLSYKYEGTYHYQLLQTTKAQESYRYDKSCYFITVYIKSNESGQMLPQVIVQKDDGKKYGELKFHNSYQSSTQGGDFGYPAEQGNVKTGDDTNIFFYIISGAVALAVVILTLHIRKKSRL